MQDKDEKTAQGGSMTRQQAEQEMEQLRKVFPSVRMLTAEQVQAGEALGDAARQALEEKITHSRMEYRGQELYEVTALFAQVEGTPCVLELERRLDRIMLLDPEESEQLFNNLAEYRGKLYRDAVTGAYNERYYQEKYRSRILTAGVAVLRVDDFKAANDVYGRYAGNSVLETVAGVLRRNLGEKDRLIRRGEDRLLLLLPEVGQSDFGQKLEHLRLQLAAARCSGLLPSAHLGEHRRCVDPGRGSIGGGGARRAAGDLCPDAEEHRDHRAAAGAHGRRAGASPPERAHRG